MTTYAAFLGNHPTISTAELSATIPDFKSIRMIGQSILLFESSVDLGNKHLPDWGGIFLLAKECATPAKSVADVPKVLVEETKNVKGKVTFSLRAYGVQKSTVHDLYRDGKKILKQSDRAVRYIGNENKPAVSALLKDSGVLDGKHGCELVLLGAEGFFWVGRTVAAQDPDAYTKRDMDKPVRDTRVGLLPPKLAQIMLNFGSWAVHEMNPKAKKSLTVFDPFCGTGVIPMEALLRGWPVFASDASLKAVNGCEKNIEWTRKEYKILKKDTPATIWKQDATKEFEFKDFPHVIVTETTLGPGLTERPTAKDAAKIRTELEATEISFLQNVAATLPGVPVIAMFPVWFLKTEPLYLEKTWKKLEDIGFKAVLPPHIKTDNPERLSLMYRRPDQVVGREIVMLLPIKK